MDTQENTKQTGNINQPRASDGVGKAVLGHLIERGLNQRELAEKLNIPPANLSAICTGKRQCGIKLATRITDALRLDGRERINFLNLVRMPKWKGLENMPNNPEAILGNLISRELGTNGIPINQIASVVPLSQQAEDCGVDAYIIMKNGEIYELELKIRKKQQ